MIILLIVFAICSTGLVLENYCSGCHEVFLIAGLAAGFLCGAITEALLDRRTTKIN